MKKVTMFLSFFILACAGNSFAQTAAVKPAKAIPAIAPVKGIAAAPATGSNAAKPKPKPKPAPKPSSSAHDVYLEIDGVKGEAGDN